MSDLHALIERLPKAELHLHLEGTLEPEMMVALAERNGVDIPYASAQEARKAYDFSDLQDFLDLYYVGMKVLVTERDFHDLTLAYFERAHADNVRHAEIFLDPQGHTERGIDFDVCMRGVLSACEEAEERFAITSKLILCFLRDLSEEKAFETLEACKPWLDRIEAVGLASAEKGNPPSKFARVFQAAADLGLKRVAHAGEEGPSEYVEEVLDVLKVDRIDHGNRALDDMALVRRLKATAMTLTVCPLSNLALKGVARLEDHPIRTMLDLGLRATINSDDPAYFGGYVNENYRRAADAVGLTREDLIQLARNSFLGSFLGEEEIYAHLAEIDAVAG